MLVITGVGLFMRSRLSVEHPGRFQIVLEDRVRAVRRAARGVDRPERRAASCRSIATLGIFILLGNYMGLVPGLMAPTSSINVTLGCAITIWVYYHFQGIKAQGIGTYLKHFAAPPGAPLLDRLRSCCRSS